MAVTTFQQERVQLRAANSRSAPPVAIVAIAVAIPALDLLALLQDAPLLGEVALGVCAFTSVALAVCLARRLSAVWLQAALLAFVASLALRVAFSGSEAAAALSLLGVLALGIGGAFEPPSGSVDLLAEDAPLLGAGLAAVDSGPDTSSLSSAL